MSYHLVENKSVTLYEALENGTSKDWTNPEKWIHYIHIIIKTIDNLHHANIIHNDIKGDNFMFGTTSENRVEPILIDFGKACYSEQGKHYNLNECDKKSYKEKHFHIAPDLREGITTQNKASDVYAFGNMVYHIYKKVKFNKKIKHIVKLCMVYSGYERPTCADIESMLLSI